MCNKATDAYPSPIQIVLDQYKTQEKYLEAADTCPVVFDSVPDQYKAQDMCDKVVSEDLFMLKYCLDRYIT